MKSIIALRTILDGKTVRCICSLDSFARLYSCVTGMEKRSACFGQIWRPPRESDNIYKISISLSCHLRHCSLPQSSSSFVAVSRNRNFRNGITDHGDSHARTSVYVVDTRHSYTNGYTPDYDRHSYFRTYLVYV